MSLVVSAPCSCPFETPVRAEALLFESQRAEIAWRFLETQEIPARVLHQRGAENARKNSLKDMLLEV